MIEAAIHGFLLALGLILPLGAQNVFVFTQGSTHSKFRGALPVVLTAALCDTLLISLSVVGVSVVVLHSFWFKTVLLTGGVLFLLYMGWLTWKSKPAAAGSPSEHSRFTPKKQIVFAASVSLLNPHAILDTVGVIGTSSLQYDGSEKVVFALLCILVSWLWFASLAMAGRGLREVDPAGRFLLLLNKLSALVMWGAAGYIVWTVWAG